MEPAEPGGFENSTFQLSIAVLKYPFIYYSLLFNLHSQIYVSWWFFFCLYAAQAGFNTIAYVSPPSLL